MIGTLPFDTVKVFNATRIELVKECYLEVADMFLGEQIKNITGKQQMLLELDRA